MKLCLTLIALIIYGIPALHAQQVWVKLEGQVIWPKALPIPERKPVAVTVNQRFILANGPILDDELLIDPKSRGLKNVWVYLRPANKDKTAKITVSPPASFWPVNRIHVVDTPRGQLVPRILAMREGDKLWIVNSAPIAQAIKLDFDGEAAVFPRVIAGNVREAGPLSASRHPGVLNCSIHPWISGRFMVFDHPYYALTDEHGKFTIPNCPAGDYHLVYRHELGYHKGKEGAYGFPVKIADNGKGVMVLEPVEFEAPK